MNFTFKLKFIIISDFCTYKKFFGYKILFLLIEFFVKVDFFTYEIFLYIS